MQKPTCSPGNTRYTHLLSFIFDPILQQMITVYADSCYIISTCMALKHHAFMQQKKSWLLCMLPWVKDLSAWYICLIFVLPIKNGCRKPWQPNVKEWKFFLQHYSTLASFCCTFHCSDSDCEGFIIHSFIH